MTLEMVFGVLILELQQKNNDKIEYIINKKHIKYIKIM
jgi:hypothetical protein